MVHWYDFLLRLGVATGAGALIGLERQWLSRGAGLRTNTLVAAGVEGLDDDEVLSLAAAEERILVTHNIRDFPAILRDWAAAERSHAGVILVYGIAHREFDVIVRRIELHPETVMWRDLAVVVNRVFVTGS